MYNKRKGKWPLAALLRERNRMKDCPNGHSTCPHPIDDSFPEIEFKPEPKMVDWLHPGQLADTGFKAAISATFGSYADKREMEAASAPYPQAQPEYFDCSQKSEVWFDYVADLGDGFNPTYALAYLFAKDSLQVGAETVNAGEFLILGGDQVYPTAGRDAYQNKFVGPYRAALPWRATPRTIFAIPGNHDWYDGLTSFLRIFCQARDGVGSGARWIGAWQTRQRRSYFAIKLPGDWWIWAIDGQLESDMDKPQLEYFEDLGNMIAGTNAKIILVTPEPNWVYCGNGGSRATCSIVAPERFNTLAHFERKYVRDKGLTVAMVIAGDLHHYVHYTSEDGKAHRITSGGGGAYLFATHQMPKMLHVHETPSAPHRVYQRTDQSTYPNDAQSKAIGAGIVRIAARNWRFGLFLGAIYLLFAWIVQSASRTSAEFQRIAGARLETDSLLDRLASPTLTFGDKVESFFKAFWFSPASIVFALIVLFVLFKFTASQKAPRPAVLGWIGFLHGVLHLFLAAVLMWVAAKIISDDAGTVPFTLMFTTLMLLLGWLAGTTLFGAYIWTASTLWGGHTNEVYASQFLEGYKNFMRFRVTPAGVDVYSIGVEKVPAKWKFNGQRTCGDPFFEPEGEAPRPHLIEKIRMT